MAWFGIPECLVSILQAAPAGTKYGNGRPAPGTYMQTQTHAHAHAVPTSFLAFPCPYPGSLPTRSLPGPSSLPYVHRPCHPQAAKLSNSHTLKRSNTQTLKPSSIQTFKGAVFIASMDMRAHCIAIFKECVQHLQRSSVHRGTLRLARTRRYATLCARPQFTSSASASQVARPTCAHDDCSRTHAPAP